MEEKRLNPTSLFKELQTSGYPISQQIIRDYYHGRALPTAEKLMWLSEALGKPMEWFFGKETQPGVPPHGGADLRMIVTAARAVIRWAEEGDREPTIDEQARLIAMLYDKGMRDKEAGEDPETGITRLLKVV